jgi:peptide/nickel transport system substrate-binding protein
MKRRTFLAASTAALALPAASRAEKGSVIKFVPWGDLGSVDPIWTPYAETRSHAFLVFDTLYGQTGAEQGFAARPQMVAGHVVDNDGRTWRLTLRDGLLFHDGSKVLARDCVASIRRWGARDPFGQTLMGRTDELSAADDRTITFRLSKPFPMLADALGKYAANVCAIMPERLAGTDPFKQITEVVGSGPFSSKADERVQGSLYVYERFNKYRPREDGKPDFLAGRSRISIVSSGTSTPTRELSRPPCVWARLTGKRRSTLTSCRCSSATPRSRCKRMAWAGCRCCGRITCFHRSTMPRSAARFSAPSTRRTA